MLEAIQDQKQKREVIAKRGGWQAERERCAADIFYWWENYLWTYNPRTVPGGAPMGYLRFDLWPKQREMVTWLQERFKASEEGLIEKSRDTGASYVCLAVALWHWCFVPGFKATFGSNLEKNVDTIGNLDSLFEKLRMMLRRLPEEMLPVGFVFERHSKSKNLENPETGATITGEGGDNMGRGGRSTVYFLDEAAHIERAEKVEAALSGNTDCVIWISSVNGMGNLFARKRHSILDAHQIFRMHWRDDPRKTEEWARKKEASFSDPTTWASEYDIDYSASVEGICIPALWVESAKRLKALEPRLKASAVSVLGGDVGAGKAKSVVIPRRGPIIEPPRSRRDPDTTETALWMLGIAEEIGAATLNFDAPGVGAGVSSTLMKNPKAGLKVVPVNTGLPPSERKWPDGRTSEEMFGNMKAEIWWLGRTAMQRTHEHVLFLEGKEGGREHPISDLLALPSGDKESDQLCLELSLVKWGRNERGKIVIEKKEELRRRGISSPDYADAFMLTNVEPPPRSVMVWEELRI